MFEPMFNWINETSLTKVLQESAYLAPFINVFHLFALTVFAGAILVVDLRLLGRGTRDQPLAQVARNAQPWLVAGLIALAITGVLQIFATPIKEYNNPSFWTKMETLIVALIFTFTVRWRVTQMDEARLGAIWGKVVALVSIGLWGTVAASGRLIGLRV
jgi:hypothetical protein